MIANGCEIREWFLRNTYNCKVYNFRKEFDDNFYYIGANLSEDVKNKILEKNGEPSLNYGGAVLEILEDDNGPIFIIQVYLVGKAVYNGYGVGYLEAEINNTTLDWKKYLNSCDFINIDVPLENINVYNSITQGFKTGCVYNNIRSFQTSDDFGLSMSEVLDKKQRTRNFSEFYKGKGYLIVPDYYEYSYTSRTPSICALSKSMCQLAETCNVCEHKDNCKKDSC